MKHKFLLVILLVCFTLISLLALTTVYFRGRIFSRPTKVPFSHIDDTVGLISILNTAGLTVNSAPISLDNRLVASISGFTVIFSKDKDLASQVRALQLVLPGLKIDNTHTPEIDLRFDKVTVR